MPYKKIPQQSYRFHVIANSKDKSQLNACDGEGKPLDSRSARAWSVALSHYFLLPDCYSVELRTSHPR